MTKKLEEILNLPESKKIVKQEEKKQENPKKEKVVLPKVETKVIYACPHCKKELS